MSRIAFVLPAAFSMLAGALVDVQSRDNYDDPRNHYDLIKDHSLVTCVCAKCGTTSFYHLLYRAVFGHPWEFHGSPYAMDLYSTRWRETFTRLSMRDVFTAAARHRIAVVRDPKERILSAWKSKLACNNKFGSVNVSDRPRNLQNIYRVAGVSPVPSCISFETYVDLLKIIYDNRDADKLDAHFMPQQFGCFVQHPARMWSLVVPISSPALREALQDIFPGLPPGVQMPHTHASKRGVWVPISNRTRAILNHITQDEYAALGNALDHAPSGEHVQGTAYQACDNAACGIPCTQHDGACVTW